MPDGFGRPRRRVDTENSPRIRHPCGNGPIPRRIGKSLLQPLAPVPTSTTPAPAPHDNTQ